MALIFTRLSSPPFCLAVRYRKSPAARCVCLLLPNRLRAFYVRNLSCIEAELVIILSQTDDFMYRLAEDFGYWFARAAKSDDMWQWAAICLLDDLHSVVHISRRVVLDIFRIRKIFLYDWIAPVPSFPVYL